MVKKDVRRFEIWLVQLNTAQNSEIKKARPYVVLSPDEMSALSTTIVAPMTTKGFTYPTRIQLTFKGKKGMILLDQVRTIDKSGLTQKLGQVPRNVKLKLIDCLQELFAY